MKSKKTISIILLGVLSLLCSVPVLAMNGELDNLGEKEEPFENIRFEQVNSEYVKETVTADFEQFLTSKSEHMMFEETVQYVDGLIQFGDHYDEQIIKKNNSGFSAFSLSAEDQLYIRMVDAMESIQMTPLSVSDLGLNGNEGLAKIKNVFSQSINGNPRFFYVSNSFGYSRDANWNIISITLTYSGANYDAILNMKSEYETELQKMLNTAAPAAQRTQMSQTELALAIHDIIVLQSKYNVEGFEMFLNKLDPLSVYPNMYNAYGTVVEKYGVCQSYSLAYIDMLSRVGVNAVYVTSEVMNHGWNLVEIADLPNSDSSAWFHIDATWDDPTFPSSPDGDEDMSGIARHAYFMRSDSEITANGDGGDHAGYDTTLPAATMSHPYSQFWNNIDSGMFFYNSLWYYNNYSYYQGGLIQGALYSSAYGPTRTGTPVSSPAAYMQRDQDKLYYYKPISSIDYNGALYCYDFETNTEKMLLNIETGYYVSELYALNQVLTYVLEAINDSSLTEIKTLNLASLNDIMYGDINGDGKADLSDALLISNYAAGRVTLTETQLLVADVNGDGSVKLDDSLLICNYIAGRFAKFPVEG